jgi:glycerol kinase
MSKPSFILAIDQGTTSSRAMLFDRDGRPAGAAQQELPQIYPQAGWVEHDAERIWTDTQAVCRKVLAEQGVDADQVVAIGITNQRETTVLWDRATGKPLHNAIVWQDRRTADVCEGLRAAGHSDLVQAKTGLLLDPYFSATKITWLLDHVQGARARAEAGELACGTIDSFLLWRLTNGARHATDATNASRTSLFDIRRQEWDEELLGLFGVPRALLPEVLDNAADFGVAAGSLLGAEIPVAGMAGDQQSALIGQACWEQGQIKSTYGTGCFTMLNTGSELPLSKNRLLGTVAYRLDGKTSYALEGSIFSAGSTMQWLRDGLGLYKDAAESEAIAAGADASRRVYLVPAFTGLGAPWWDAHARGAIVGLTRDTDAADIVLAGLQAVGYQSYDLLSAMEADGAARPSALRVDGGMANNDLAMQFLADVLDLPVERPAVTETTVLGAACLAGLQSGLYTSRDALAGNWSLDRRFEPAMGADERAERLAGWSAAVQSVLTRD